MTIRSLVGASEGYDGSRFSVIGANPGVLDGNFESIATVNITASGTNIFSFSGIPQTYRHLQLRILTRILNGNNFAEIDLTMNGGTGGQFNRYILQGNGSSVSQVHSGSQAQFRIPAMGSGTTSNYGVHIIDFLDYSNTTKFKTMTCLFGRDVLGGTDSNIAVVSGVWRTTTAINAINFYALGDYGPGSVFALYGVKA